jgi:6-phosphogluconate dehydrogenase
MQLGMIGLGRMGGNIVRRLMQAGHGCVVYDKSADAVSGLAREGARRAATSPICKQPSAARGLGAQRCDHPCDDRRTVRPARATDDGGTGLQDDAPREMLNGNRLLDVGTSGACGAERGC